MWFILALIRLCFVQVFTVGMFCKKCDHEVPRTMDGMCYKCGLKAHLAEVDGDPCGSYGWPCTTCPETNCPHKEVA